MISNTKLSKMTGLNLELTQAGRLVLDPGLIIDEAYPRLREKLREYALDPAACAPADQVQYDMWNHIYHDANVVDRCRRTGFRYALTLMYGHAIGRERDKTLGHWHSKPAGATLNYAEILEVHYGTAYFLMHTLDLAAKSAPWCSVIKANAGQTVVIPPNTHHLTINATDGLLLFADVSPRAVFGYYEPFAQMHGAAYLRTIDDTWIKNPTYAHVADLEMLTAHEYPQYGLTDATPLYETFIQTPEKLAWILQPDQFHNYFPDIWEIAGPHVVEHPYK